MQEMSLRLTEDSAPTLFTPASHVGSARSVRKVTSARTVLARTASPGVQALSEAQAHVDPFLRAHTHALTHEHAHDRQRTISGMHSRTRPDTDTPTHHLLNRMHDLGSSVPRRPRRCSLSRQNPSPPQSQGTGHCPSHHKTPQPPETSQPPKWKTR